MAEILAAATEKRGGIGAATGIYFTAMICHRVRKKSGPAAMAGLAMLGSPRSFSATRSNLSAARTTTTRPFSAVQ